MFREEIPYEPYPVERDPDKRRGYYEVGKGLQAIDGIPTSDYFDQVMEESLAGKYDTKEVTKKLIHYYNEMNPTDSKYDSREADISASRIADVLESLPFNFVTGMLGALHRKIFEDYKPDYLPGEWRKPGKDFRKKECVLNNQSVEYGLSDIISGSLHDTFIEEKYYDYSPEFGTEAIANLVRFVSSVWQIHPFYEGNTRTIATFTIMYLRSMGFKINNEPFMKHSVYFRDALTRSAFSNEELGVEANFNFLEKFFDNMIHNAGHDLESFDLRCLELFPTDHNEEGQPKHID